jgi:hypothetical protein
MRMDMQSKAKLRAEARWARGRGEEDERSCDSRAGATAVAEIKAGQGKGGRYVAPSSIGRLRCEGMVHEGSAELTMKAIRCEARRNTF